MGKDVILDRYARLYEIPRQLALLGHDVQAHCLDYHGRGSGMWSHEAAPGTLTWKSTSLAILRMPLAYPWQVLKELKSFRPDVLLAASDIPHVALGAWLASRLGVPYAVDLYDNFEGFGQARIPGFVPALRRAARKAAMVTTTSEPLRQLVMQEYRAQGAVISMPSSVDLRVFTPGDRLLARKRLGLPTKGLLIGTAGGLYRDKGVEPIYQARTLLAARFPNLHLVLAGPFRPDLPPPEDPQVHYLGQLAHSQVADLFRALDVGIISILDTPFGRYCFPQKAYEMLACGLPVVATDIGEMSTLFADVPQVLFAPGDATGLAAAIERQLAAPVTPAVPILDWQALVGRVEAILTQIVRARSG
ncbi:MAG TPA: glycosyltransferase family 4 protein [Burkholderiaceae bacterium]|nr:glycosyltransferase family 4 protein [Burkholderiaceae bacterium]